MSDEHIAPITVRVPTWPALVYAGRRGADRRRHRRLDKDGRLDVVVTDTAYGLNGGVSILLNTSH
jgi:hypothetical protein